MLFKFASLFPVWITALFVVVTAVAQRKALTSVTAFVFLGCISMLGLAALATNAMAVLGAATHTVLFVFQSGEAPTLEEIQRGLATQTLVAALLLLIFGRPLLRWLCDLLKSK